MLAKSMPAFRWSSHRMRHGATHRLLAKAVSLSSNAPNSRHFVSHLGNPGHERRLTLTLQRYGHAGAERQVSFPFVLCSDKEPVSKRGSDGKEGVAR
jgi:hypothetical protein